jgi:flagellar motor component MotA
MMIQAILIAGGFLIGCMLRIMWNKHEESERKLWELEKKRERLKLAEHLIEDLKKIQKAAHREGYSALGKNTSDLIDWLAYDYPESENPDVFLIKYLKLWSLIKLYESNAND